jgi:hypothetical protein
MHDYVTAEEDKVAKPLSFSKMGLVLAQGIQRLASCD